jgi:ligand-binding sensor domain-containing protein
MIFLPKISIMQRTIWFIFALLVTSLSLPAQTWIQFNTSNSNVQSNDFRDIVVDNSEVWAASVAGIHKRSQSVWSFWNTTNSPLPTDNQTAVLVLPNGDKVIAMDGGGVSFFDGVFSWANFQTGTSNIPNNRVLSAANDGDDIWIGTMGGAAFWNGMLWTAFTTANSGLPSDTIYGVAIDELSRVWFSTHAGMARYDGSSWAVFDLNNSPLPTNQPKRLRADPTSGIWICTDTHGLLYTDTGGNTWTIYNVNNSGLLSNHVTDVAPTLGGLTWITTHKGLSRLDASSLTTLTTSNSSLPTDSLQSIAAVTDTRVWIGTYDEGILLYDTMTVGIADAMPGTSVGISPLPLRTRSQVRVHGSDLADMNFELYNLQGKRLFRQPLAGGEMILNRSAVESAGLYFYTVRNAVDGSWIGGGKMLVE